MCRGALRRCASSMMVISRLVENTGMKWVWTMAGAPFTYITSFLFSRGTINRFRMALASSFCLPRSSRRSIPPFAFIIGDVS